MRFLFENPPFNPKITRFLFTNPPFNPKSTRFLFANPPFKRKSGSSQILHLSENHVFSLRKSRI
ncbi:hypothetical protein CP10139811_1293 [Chlamydia ibidis]|uniref:Uncharacterized protein n=1 Tax=Chlamydia ibidis TaxID=1405396 RepID=S7KH55_9CHLA|nr:hypothetical protein CP10139811_1293 [Chlamydia ibidis]